MEHTIQIQPLEPLLIRDGRPFGITPGARAHSLDTVTPGVVAGTLRTLMGKNMSKYGLNEADVKPRRWKTLAKVGVRGPLYMLNDRLFLPMPNDLDLKEPNLKLDTEKVIVSARRPCKPLGNMDTMQQGFIGTGKTGLHEDKLWPVRMPLGILKPLKSAPAYVSAEWMIRWLCDETQPEQWSDALEQWRSQKARELTRAATAGKQREVDSDVHFIAPFVREVRTHTAIQEETYTAKDQALFSTESLVVPPDVSLIASVNIPPDSDWKGEISGIHSFGGKRRLAYFQEIRDKEIHHEIWKCPEPILKAVAAQPKYLRMVLTTPAYFSKGWIPGWLDENLESNDKFDKTSAELGQKLQVRLRWACLPRWEGISGWSYFHNKPKAVRRMVAAGSVYFFEVMGGDPVDFVRRNWLVSISDEDRRKAFFDKEDGYGLATWGVWTPHEQ